MPAGGAAESPAGCVACGVDVEAGALAESEGEGPCADEAEDCREELLRRQEDRLAAIDLDIRVGGRPGNDYPCECRLEGETFEPRRFASTTFTWKAAGYCHKPLYFEDWLLERYGHSHGGLADPFVSAAHFFVTLPVLPYKMGVELPWECVYPLGYYRPGDCAPGWYRPCRSARGASPSRRRRSPAFCSSCRSGRSPPRPARPGGRGRSLAGSQRLKRRGSPDSGHGVTGLRIRTASALADGGDVGVAAGDRLEADLGPAGAAQLHQGVVDLGAVVDVEQATATS